MKGWGSQNFVPSLETSFCPSGCNSICAAEMAQIFRVARLQSEFCTKEFFRATNLLTKNAPKFSPKILSLCSVGQEKIPENSLQISHQFFQISLRKIKKSSPTSFCRSAEWRKSRSRCGDGFAKAFWRRKPLAIAIFRKSLKEGKGYQNMAPSLLEPRVFF